MAIYCYFCEFCSKEFEVVQSMNDLPISDCVECGKMSKHRVPQLFSAIDKTPHTLGGLADQKRSEMGTYCYEDTIQKMANDRKVEFKGRLPEGCEQIQPTKDRPFWRKDLATPDYSLTKLTPEQTTKYIMEGRKPAV